MRLGLPHPVHTQEARAGTSQLLPNEQEAPRGGQPSLEGQLQDSQSSAMLLLLVTVPLLQQDRQLALKSIY